MKEITGVLTANFHENDALPLVGGISPKTASYMSIGVYTVAFITSFVAYSTFDSLKTTVTYITTTPGDNCAILASFTGSFFSSDYSVHTVIGDTIASYDAAYRAYTSPKTLVSGNGITQGVIYQNSYFASYEECAASPKLDVTCT